MYKHIFSKKPLVLAMALAAAFTGSAAVNSMAQADNDTDDKLLSSAVPDNITQLSGMQIGYENYRDFVTTGRPWSDRSKMFVLYNVGTGKFLNTGSYWGTQTALSDVPRLFWLQRRNETVVNNQWAYVRYPLSANDPSEGNGYFYHDFFALKNMQVGNTEGKYRSNVTYKYVRLMNLATGEKVKDIIAENTASNGSSFKETISDMDFSKYYLEAEIDMTGCTGEKVAGSNGSHTYKNIETILSFGENVDKWAAGKDGYTDLHIYGYQDKTVTDGSVQYGLKVQALDHQTYSDGNSLSGTSSQNPISIGSDNLVHVVIKKGSILVNGTQCMPRNTPTYTSPLNTFLTQTALQVGAAQGNTLSNATYNYVRVHTARQQAPCDSCLLVNGTYRADGLSFYKDLKGNLSNWMIRADIDLSTVPADAGDENILSVGNAIDTWGTGTGENNLHLYYNAAEGKLKCCAVNSSNKSGIKAELAKKGTATLVLSADGLFIDGTKVDGFGADNAVISQLSGTGVTTLQVGNAQYDGNKASHATYHYVKTNYTATKHSFPENGDVWDGTPFVKTLDGNLQNWEVYATLDLSTCKGEEEVITIGTDVGEWGIKDGMANIHVYYTPSSKKLQFDAVNSNNTSDQYRKTYTLTDDALKNVSVKLNKSGLFYNGELVTGSKGDYSATNPIVKYLLENAAAIQLGSKDAKKISRATYTVMEILPVDANTQNVVRPGTAGDGTKWGYSYSGTLDDKTIEAEIDLSTTGKGGTENVLSIGNDIAKWGTDNANQANIHFYYNGSQLFWQAVNQKYKNGTKNTLALPKNSVVKVKLSKDGLYVNDQLQSTFCDYKNNNKEVDAAEFLATLLDNTKTTAIQVGSREGENKAPQGRSFATYNKLTVTTATAEQTAATAAANRKTAVAKAETTATQTVYTPMSNQQGNGTTAYLSDVYDIDFSAGDYIEASIDLSTCKKQYENIFSVGTDIKSWGQNEKAHNLHIYNTGTDANGNITCYVAYVNKDHSDDFKRAFTVTKQSDGTAIMTVKLSAEGLFINGKDMYPSVDPIPTVSYDENLVGDIVRFKWDTVNKMPVLDGNGQYIPLKEGDEGYEDAHGIKTSVNNYLFTTESRTDNSMPLFISTRFNQESKANQNEGVFLSWAPYLSNNDKWGSVGVFADRALPQVEVGAEQSVACSEWYFDEVPGVSSTGNHVYTISLKMDNVKVPYRIGNSKWDFSTKSGRFYLQAFSTDVYGNSLENYGGGYDGDNTEKNLDVVEAVNNTPSTLANPAYAYWKLFTIDEYYRLFESAKSEMTSMLDLSFLLRDPDFSRESEELPNWKMDSNMQATAENNLLRIGYDYLSKKLTTDKDYTDEEGKRDIKKDNVYTEEGSEQYKTVVARTNNHGRYMGVDVRKDGYGKLYQDVTLNYAGWYAIGCSGMSNAGAKLFMQLVTDTVTGAVASAISQPLYKLGDEEKAAFESTRQTWPFDQVDNTYPMPMYNAIVAMNDANVPESLGGNRTAKYKTQVAFFVDPAVLADNGGSLTLRFGIDIPSATAQAAADSDVAEQADNSADATGTDNRWTVFDNFHLMFGGRSMEPNIILDEDRTDMDYLDDALHVFEQRPMRLKRTFKGGQWNTLMLPVTLTASDFNSLFGDNAKLAELDCLTERTIEFKTLDKTADNGANFLQAFKPYIIWVDTDHEQGSTAAYTATLADRLTSGKTLYNVEIGDNHFYLQAANLEGKHQDEGTQQYYYSFADDTKKEQTIDFGTATALTTGSLYTYKDSHVATGNSECSLRAYGSLCKNFGLVDGKNAILDGRPALGDAYVMATGGMRHINTGGQYGTKGFRCWFMPESTSTAPASFKVAIDGVEDDTTGIDDINNADGLLIRGHFTDGVYSLSGQMVRRGTSLQGLPAGIYIVGGMKYAVK